MAREITEDEVRDVAARHPVAMRGFQSLRLWVVGFLALFAAYCAVLWWEFDVSGAIARYDSERLAIATRDIHSHKIRVFVDLRSAEPPLVTMETDRRSVFDPYPDWVSGADGRYVIDLGASGSVEIAPNRVFVTNPEGAIAAIEVADGESAAPVLLTRDAPWVDWDGGRVLVAFDGDARLRITSSRLEIFRYYSGWENFWFEFGHPLNGASFSTLWNSAWSDAPISADQPADQSNARYILASFLGNKEWQHGEVYQALWLTILMALLGTMLASLVGLPLAFLAARNVNPIAPLRLAVKKLFDFLRAVDTLIWSLILIRGFGPGPLAGTLAIFLTDTGTLGKLYSEAIENADRRQVEGVGSVGAGKIQQNWFGIVPQILPVFISQGLYFLESNTRSATIIGILGAGGIGLKLADTMRTGSDWENTMYIIFLIVLVVIAMDNFSAWARRRLIEGKSPELETIIEKQRARRGLLDKGVAQGA